MIAGKLENGLEINLVGEVTSRSYIEMTLDILTKFGIKNSFISNTIKVESTNNHQLSTINYEVESDWSSASYFYSFAALGRKTIHLKSFYKESTQGDSAIAEIYELPVDKAFIQKMKMLERYELERSWKKEGDGRGK